MTAKTTPTASKGMTLEELTKKLSSNPRFKEAKNSGEAYIIGGVKPPKQSDCLSRKPGLLRSK
jgi:hypothetical protein